MLTVGITQDFPALSSPLLCLLSGPTLPIHLSPLLYIFQLPCCSLINYKVSINKRVQLFACSAISLVKAIFILRPFIYHHSTPVRLEPLATVKAIPINIIDLWVDVFLGALNNVVIYMLICHFFSVAGSWMQSINPKPLQGVDHQGHVLSKIKTTPRVFRLKIQLMWTVVALYIMTGCSSRLLRLLVSAVSLDKSQNYPYHESSAVVSCSK